MQRRHFLQQSLLASAGTVLLPQFLKAGGKTPAEGLATISAKVKGEKLAHFWSKCVGAGRANEGLRAGWLEQLKLVKDECGFEFCRFHGLFHDDMFVYHEVAGKPVYNWQYIDDLFDRMLDIGVKPFVELGFMPAALSSDDSMLQFWWKGHVSPPKDYSKWADLVSEFTKHCITRYGKDEVRSWYFEVWNEPNLRGFWLGTKSQYFELYKVSVNAIKAIDSTLRVGGPSTSNFVPDDRFAGDVEDKTKHKTLTVSDINTLAWQGVWIKDFLAYCTMEKLPVDFISCHPYPTDWALDPMTGKGGGRVRKVNATKEDLRWLQQTVKASAFPNAELHCTEWSSSPSPRDTTHDSLQAATYVIKANLDSIGFAHSLSYWTFTDVFEEKGGADSIYHGGFGMINFQGIVKPSFHAYRMLHALGNEVLQKEDGYIITQNSATGAVIALLYHYPPERANVPDGDVDSVLNTGAAKKMGFTVKDLNPGTVVHIETLDRNNGFGYAKWTAMGNPEPPTREQCKTLKEAALAVKKEIASVSANGSYTFDRTLQPWDCVLVQIGAVTNPIKTALNNF